MNKQDFQKIEAAFTMLKEQPDAAAPRDIIKDTLNEVFNNKSIFKSNTKYDFNVSVVSSNKLFVMSVYPERSTIDKIVTALANGSDEKVISKLWETNKTWTIEIDKNIISSSQAAPGLYIDLSPKELTAMLLHEIGHIMNSNSIIGRVNLIVKYEIARAGFRVKALANDFAFRNIMSLPILDSCIADKKKSGKDLADEIRADKFVTSMGYRNELYNSLKKVSAKLKSDADKDLREISSFSVDKLKELDERKDKLVKNDLLRLKEETTSPFLESVLDDTINMIFIDGENMYEGEKLDLSYERADNLIDKYVTEFFIFGQKDLKRIDPAELDYILVQMEGIKNHNDKMMLISYIYSKLDIINYYIDILQSPKLSKKYYVPHTMSQLQQMKERLLSYRDAIIKYKIPERNNNILVQWPNGYEG
jgi:hypothetical protein